MAKKRESKSLLEPSRIRNAEGLKEVAHLVVTDPKKAATRLHVPNHPVTPRDREVVLFVSFIKAGLVPPFSPFFHAILEIYGIHLAHLCPNMET
jgi:hypothetical protein